MENPDTNKPKIQKSYGDLLLGLKTECGIYPTDTNYSDIVKEWIEKNIFHDQPLSEDVASEIQKFSDKFKKRSREIWKENSSKVYYGRSARVNTWLGTIIPLDCKCSSCIGNVEEMELDSTVVEVEDLGPDENADQKSEEPNGLSKSSSVSFCTF